MIPLADLARVNETVSSFQSQQERRDAKKPKLNLRRFRATI